MRWIFFDILHLRTPLFFFFFFLWPVQFGWDSTVAAALGKAQGWEFRRFEFILTSAEWLLPSECLMESAWLLSLTPNTVRPWAHNRALQTLRSLLGVWPPVLKSSSNMVQMYTRCTLGEAAEDWKKANVTTVFKKSKKEELQRDYRLEELQAGQPHHLL